MLNNLFPGHNLRGIKKSRNKDLNSWLTRENKNIHVFGQKAPISLAIEIGNRFLTLTKNCSIIIVQYDNIVEFLEVFHHEEQRVLIQLFKEEKKHFITQMGTLFIIFRCLIIPF